MAVLRKLDVGRHGDAVESNHRMLQHETTRVLDALFEDMGSELVQLTNDLGGIGPWRHPERDGIEVTGEVDSIGPVGSQHEHRMRELEVVSAGGRRREHHEEANESAHAAQ